jgi:hypothetical protein
MNRFAQARQESRVRMQRINAGVQDEVRDEPAAPAYQGQMDVTA